MSTKPREGQVAQDIGARIVILSTLLTDVSAEVNENLDKLREQYPDLTIHLALRADLEKGYLSSRQTNNAINLSDLLPRSRVQRTGIIQEPGERIATF